MNATAAIDRVKATLHQPPVLEGRDPRWQAIIDLGDHLDREPETIWTFLQEEQHTTDEDLRAALATCLLEHLIECHPDYRARAEQLAAGSPDFRKMLELCW